MSNGYQSTDDRQLIACEGKIGFGTASLAERVIKRNSREKANFGARKLYRCRHCRLYHLGESKLGRFRHDTKGRHKGPVRLFIETVFEEQGNDYAPVNL